MISHSPYIRNISVAILKLQETSVLSKGVQQVCVGWFMRYELSFWTPLGGSQWSLYLAGKTGHDQN